MSSTTKVIPFRTNAAQAVRDATLRSAMRNATDTFTIKRADALSGKPVEEWREQVSAMRMHVLDKLSDYVDRFEKNATRAGAKVYRATDSQEARERISSILKNHGITRVVKSKSMISEEIHLNDYLGKQGIVAVETDFGEYIIQIAGEGPSHIIVPAIHKDRRQVGKLFAEKLGGEYTDDPLVLTGIARKILREEFLSAKAGISGANFAVADSGSIILFTNEGNGRMCTTLPPLHIAVLSIEKMVPSLADLPKFTRLLPRSATGQALTTYMSVITGTRKPGESTGAEEMHIVLLDNGRSEIVKGPYREMLKCIRCGACLNACPVYRMVGGHAYAATYPGPMGIVLTTLLDGMGNAHPLLDATTLCGACGDVCPVKVPLPGLLRRLRECRVEEGFTPKLEQAGMAGFGRAVQSPFLFHLGQTAGHFLWPVATKNGIAGCSRTFAPASSNDIKPEDFMTRDEIIGLFIENATKVAAEPVRVKNNDELNHVLAPIMVQCESIYCPGVTDTEKAIQEPPDKHNPDYVSASVCLEEVSAAIAETGSLICSSQGGKPVQAGLLAAHHVAILSADNIYESLDQFFSTLGDSPPTNITLETGPSRTADIELTLTIGVHGPGRLTVIVF